jgi:uncharacterized coiled-coil protein SlyX
MNDQLSATIIPFPVRTRETPVASSDGVIAGSAPLADSPELSHTLASSAQRLTYALNGLSNALADQRDATQRWKSALEDLANKMRTLSDVSKFGMGAGSNGGSAEFCGNKIAENSARKP